MTTPAELVARLSRTELDAVIEGRTRIGEDQATQIAVWNAAIDRDNGYDL